ncbi:MAG: Ig-like domain-containing protein [Bacteroidales bacterium]
MDKKLVFLLIIFSLSFLVFISFVFRRSSLSSLIRASEETEPSIEKSMIFAWPLLVKAGENTPVQISVFVKNSKDIPLANKKVTILSNLGQVKENNILTDKNGGAQFILENNQPGTAVIEAIVNDNFKLTKKVSIKYE